jgi:2-polyprenyl-6-methoxyphenol hydroxylase-like FAD-dependent oxidoreductase
MAHAVVIGAGVGGLGAALALSGAGHRVTLLERDATPMPSGPDEAFAWDRRGAPQVRHSHALLARLRNLLRDRHPTVLHDLLDAGATEIRFADMLPEEITDREPREHDDDLVAIACRRTTFEWVLRRAVLESTRVALRDGVAVTGLLAESGTEGPPRVTGVRYQHDGAEAAIDADLVVAANGRRSAVPAWMQAIGVEIPEVEDDTGIVYFSRFYRLVDDVEPPVQNGPVGGDLGYLKYAVFQGDNRTFSITFAAQHDDRELRGMLLDPDRFDDGARLMPATAAWADPALATPITPVFVMAKLVNRLRTFTLDGAPRVLGFHAVGDAHTCTNPLYGRGCSLAMVQADLVADALAAHPDDLVARALAFEEASARDVEPWYHSSLLQDRQSRLFVERERKVARGEDLGELADDPGVQMADLMRHGLFPATRLDPDVFRAFIRAFNLLDAPDTLLADATIIGRVLEVYQDRDSRPPEEPLGPPRREMLAHLNERAA